MTNGVVTYINGEAGSAFYYDGAGDYVEVPASSALNVGLGAGFTLEGWIKPNDLVSQLPLFEWQFDGVEVGVHFWTSTDGGAGCLFANIVDTNNNAHSFYSAAGILTTNYQHVALTYNKMTGIACIYRNGVIVASQNLGTFTPKTKSDFLLGARTYLTGAVPEFIFSGSLDEMSIYNRVLTTNEIAAIYNAGSAGKCVPTCTQAPSDLAGWWKGDGNANDSKGTNNGIPTTITYANGEVGQAFVFDGSASQVRIPANPDLNVGTNNAGFTLMGWVNPASSTVSNIQSLIQWNQSSGFSGGPIGTHLEISGSFDADLHLNVFDTTLTGHNLYSPPGIMLGDVWQHVAATYDKTTGNAVLYRNGVVVASGNLGTGFTPRTDIDLYLGTRPAGSFVNYFKGQIDEAMVFKRPLSQAEIQSIYNAGSAGVCAPASDCTPAPSGLVSWWPAEGNGDDIVGGNNGTLQGGTTFAPGEVGQAFVFNGSDSSVRVPASTSLDVGLGDGFTIETWINPLDFSFQSICEWNNDGNYNSGFGAGEIGVHLELNEYNADGSLWGNVVDTSGVSHNLYSPPGVIATNSLQHVAMTYDKASGMATLYQNGVVVAATNLGIFTPQTSSDFFMGTRPAGPFAGIHFNGEIDELSLYNRALATNEIAALYNAGSSGKCQSSAVIAQQPLNQTTVAGSGATLTVGMGGIGPFTYQWRFNGTNISGATNATLTLANLHGNQSGHYSVVITTPGGTLISSDAIVTVIPQDILVYNYSGKEQITTFNQDLSYNYSGEMLLIPAATNGTFVGWATINGKKQYWVSPMNHHLWINIARKNGHAYTVLGYAGDGIDTNGYPHLWSSLHRGVNSQLAIAKKRTFSFPNTFTCVDNHIYPDTNTGHIIMVDANSSYQFAPANTQTANNAGQTLPDLINALTKSLEKQGYQKQ